MHLLTTVSMSDRKHSVFQRVSGINKFSHWVDHRYLEFGFIEQGSIFKLLSSSSGKERHKIKPYGPVQTRALKALIPCQSHFWLWVHLSRCLG